MSKIFDFVSLAALLNLTGGHAHLSIDGEGDMSRLWLVNLDSQTVVPFLDKGEAGY